MRRLSIFISLLLSLNVLLAPAVILTGQAGAVQIFSNCGNGSAAGNPDVCPAAQNTPKENPVISILKVAIDIISYIVGAASVIGILVSSLRLMTAGGDSNAVGSARSGLLYSLIGLAVTALSQVFVVFVLNQ